MKKKITKEKEIDWWDTLSEAQKKDIEAGLTDLKNNRMNPFAEVLSKYKVIPRNFE